MHYLTFLFQIFLQVDLYPCDSDCCIILFFLQEHLKLSHFSVLQLHVLSVNEFQADFLQLNSLKLIRGSFSHPSNAMPY